MMVYNNSEDCAPYMMFFTEEEANKLDLLFGDNYIISPMSYDQSLAYIWRTLPKHEQKRFNVFIVNNKHDWFKYFYEERIIKGKGED